MNSLVEAQQAVYCFQQRSGWPRCFCQLQTASVANIFLSEHCNLPCRVNPRTLLQQDRVRKEVIV
jgi:hypothetical protein